MAHEVVPSLGSDAVPDSGPPLVPLPPHGKFIMSPNSGSHTDFSLHSENCILVVFKIRKSVFILKDEFYCNF